MADGQQSPKRERDTEADGMKLGAIKRCCIDAKEFYIYQDDGGEQWDRNAHGGMAG